MQNTSKIVIVLSHYYIIIPDSFVLLYWDIFDDITNVVYIAISLCSCDFFGDTNILHFRTNDFAYRHVNNYQNSPTRQSKFVLHGNNYNTYIQMTCWNQSNIYIHSKIFVGIYAEN